MPKPQPKTRSMTQLSSSQSQKLKAYALAATATGVGLLALGQPAQAEVVYTPAHVHFKGVGTLYYLDVNHDGAVDYQVVLTNVRGLGLLSVGPIYENGAPSSNGLEYKNEILFPIPLNSGAPIGTHDKFFGCGTCTTGGELVLALPGKDYGYWFNVNNRYLGLKFFVGSNAYYGWARLSVKVNGMNVTALLSGYAYENVPGQPIHAGQTSGTFDDPVFGDESPASIQGGAPEQFTEPSPNAATLGRLALGAAGVPANRQRYRRNDTLATDTP